MACAGRICTRAQLALWLFLTMDYGELYGVEDDEFESQFASELEVLAELDDDRPTPSEPKASKFRQKRSFEDEIASGDDVLNSTVLNHKVQPRANGKVGTPTVEAEGAHGKKRGSEDMLQDSEEDFNLDLSESLIDFQPSLTPKPKRPRLEAVKKLDFGAKEDCFLPDISSDDITPPSTPENTKRPSLRNTKFLAAEPLEISDMAPLHMTPMGRDRKRVQNRPPIFEEYIHVTAADGKRAYMTLKEDTQGSEVEYSKAGGFDWNGERQLHLLGVPFSYLKEQVADERRKQILEESQRLTELLNSHIDREFGEGENEDIEVAAGEESDDDDNDDESSSRCLWVDRYTPRHYTELLSDDYTNRCLLKWLKLWDTVVFGREKVVRKAKPTTDTRQSFKDQKKEPWQQNNTRQSFKDQKKEQWQQNKFKTKAEIVEEILEAELDQHKRPKNKMALLCGPPGLGKTTLAHVIAKHAGYNVVEMNASDDRSPDIFKTRIEAATQMKSVLGVNEKPNCLIIDEIDGAQAVAINMLLSLVNRKDGKEVDTGAAPAPTAGGKKKKKDGGLLLRPIICICNDQYAPSLRQLRPQAFILNFPETLPSRLVQRLYEVSLNQGMKADTGALMALCEKTDNDIRSCINTLQFLHGRGKKELNMRMVQTLRIGQKDQNKGLFTVWQEIFQLPKAQRKRIGPDLAQPSHLLLGEENDPLNLAGRMPLSVLSQRFNNILHLASSTGEFEKITQGLYDNFLNMKVKDASFGTVCLAMDWLEFTDILNVTIMHGQNFQLMRYLPFLPVVFHLMFAASNVPRIAYPNSNYEALSKLNQVKNLLTSMITEIHPGIRSHVGPQSLVLEALCLLLDIITPKLRPINTQLYSIKEKQQLADLINTMLAYNLTYHQERSPDGQYLYKLDPNVEDICRFPDLPARKQLTYQTKQLIAREIELEKMRRTEAHQLARNANQATRNPQEVPKSMSLKSKALPKPVVRNHEQRLEGIIKKATFEERPETDFFGRVIVKKVEEPVSVSSEPEKVSIEKQIGTAVGKSDVWFRFNEGVSNAVRRNVYIKDLM
ncbi:chromosome transmission fidelity protein 18 homolog isoform X2 [Ambystoma mexicanum]|uniref:chromosome transmission fidelity protein 18 homolog isoform X2 n=1 Tax=Ambystoma mexicanum TaxID=8296 RepID=UPI0037E7569E